MSLMVNQLSGFGAGGSAVAPTLTFIGTASLTTNTSTYTFSSQDIGTPGSDRLVVVVAAAYESSSSAGDTPSSITIGGVSATIHATGAGTGFNSASVSIASLLVASGSTADIVVTMPDAQVGMAIVVLALTGYSSAVPTTDATAISGGTDISLSMAVGPLHVGIIASAAAASGRSCGWSNATEVAEIEQSDGDGTLSVAILETASGTQTRTATWSASSYKSIAAAVWT